jgi:hypothetical protein
MVPYLRGGIPAHLNGTAVASAPGIPVRIEKTEAGRGVVSGVANSLFFKNTGATSLTLSLDAASSASGVGLTVGPGESWCGPAEIAQFWVIGTATFEAIAFMRRG